MGQIIGVIRRCLPLCFPLPESEDQNEASHVVGVEDQDEDVQSNSTTRSTSTSMAAQALPSSSESGWDYDVFLSFRGEDTRNNFTDHLYAALVRVGIHTFRDNEELRRGKTISTELLDAIRGSRISIVIFSKGYASSRWCLDELVEIVDCKNTRGHTLLPIFYHVDPSDVRKQTKTFAKAFARHEEQFQTDTERVQRWRKDLTEAASCSGYHIKDVENGYESRFIEAIVEEVLCKVNPACLNVAKHPVGIDSHVENMRALLNLETSDVLIVGIYGMGGIGKTTIANAVYNEICVAFEGSSFLSNIKESSEKPTGLVHLQEKLLYDILKKNLKIDNVDRGIILIKERLRRKRVLVILDDVDDFEKLHTLVEKQWFGSGSRIIVTTRDEHLLKQLGVDKKYKVEELNPQESLRLFSWHAFEMTNPEVDYLKLSIEAVNYTRGLPLALVVLGSFLKQRSIAEWKSGLEKLRRTTHEKIQKILRISFDSLDSSTKDIFLDIACFFTGMDEEYVIKILDDCNLSPKSGIPILIQRSLVTIGYQNKLKMHNLIQDMGREIVCEESPKYPGKRSRLWFHKDVLSVLHERTIFNKLKVLNLTNSIYLTRLPDFSQVPQLEILMLEGCTNLKDLPNFLESSHLENLNLEGCTSLIEIHESIGLLKRLVLLNLRGCKNLRNLSPSISKVKSLKTLVLSKCFNLKKVPKQLGNMTVLTKLYLEKIAIKELPFSFSLLENLETLSLRGCKCLIKSPEFSQTSRLECLKLKGCTSLVEIHESIGFLKRLQFLSLKGCQELENLPSSMSNLEIKALSLCGCSKLQKLPEEFGHKTALRQLRRLSLDECTTLKSISLPVRLDQNLSAVGCTSLETILILNNNLGIRYFNVSKCNKLVEIQNLKSVKFAFSGIMGGCNSLADDFRNSIFQAQFPLFEVWLPGSEIPNWFMYQAIGSSISFRVPPSLDGKTGKVLICLVRARKEFEFGASLRWTVYKNGKFCLNGRSCMGHVCGEHIYVSQDILGFGFRELELKSGDEINLESKDDVKKCGIHFLVDESNVSDADKSDFDTCKYSGDDESSVSDADQSEEYIPPCPGMWSDLLASDADKSDFDTCTYGDDESYVSDADQSEEHNPSCTGTWSDLSDLEYNPPWMWSDLLADLD